MKTAISCCVPVRFYVGMMACLITSTAYMLRANISINMLAMARKDENDPDYGPRYDWSKDDTSQVLGAFFIGSCITGFPAGFLCEWFGGKLSTTIALVVSCVLTGLTPIMADWSVWAVYANRIVIGLAGSFFYPAMHNMISKWAPPDEKGKFVAALLDGNLGTVVTFQLSGLLTPLVGWRNVFYGEAVIILIVTILWITLVANRPSVHRFISAKELQYIENSLPNVSKKKTVPPYLRIAKSPTFHALNILHYGNLWGLFFLLTIAPEFMADALGFNFQKAGIYSGLPHLARFFAGFIFGWIGDCLRRRNITPNRTRKSFCVFSHIIPGLLLLSIPYITEPGVVVAILTISLGFNGSAVLTNLQNSQDLAPNYAGTLYSIINTIGFTAGAFGPIVKNELSKLSEENNFDPWTVMFIIGGLGYIVPVIVFWIFGSAEVQEWNESKKHDTDQQNIQSIEKQPTYKRHSINDDLSEEKRTTF